MLRFDWINREEESFVFYKPFIYMLKIIDLFDINHSSVTHKLFVCSV